MNAIERYNSPAFRERMSYFDTSEYDRRLGRLMRRVRRDPGITLAKMMSILGCTEEEFRVWLTLVDAVRAHTGRMPVHGFPAITDPTSMTIDVRLRSDGSLTDYRFSHPLSPLPSAQGNAASPFAKGVLH